MAGRQIALLRGINVGRAKRIAMGDLRALVENLGYQDVRTVLNSGNVIFTAPGRARGADPATRIEQALAHKLGIASRVTVLSADELAIAIGENPLGKFSYDPSRLHFAVLAGTADRAGLKSLLRTDWTPEALAIGSRVAYLWCPDGVIKGRVAEAVGRVLGESVTMRNLATMTKLHALTRG
jgi:uncharacterized protein (DUF1697 family)